MMSSIFLICDGISGRGKITAGQIRSGANTFYDTRESLREWYDGYHTAAGERLYNPRSVVCALTDNQLLNYWVSSGKYDSIFTYIQYNVDQIQNDLTLMFAGERIPSGIQEYAATAQELKTKEEIYSAMVVYELLTYDNGMVFIPNKELMEVLKWELVMIKKQKNTPVKQKSYRVNKMMRVWRKPYPLLKIIREQDLR